LGDRGPLPLPYARRRNKRATQGKIAVGRPPMPRDLPKEAKAEWHRIVPALENAGTLAAIDRGVLVRYCCAWADWVELDGMIRQSGKLIRGQKNNLVRNPLLIVRSDVEATLSDLGKQLGLSPGARMRAGIAHEVPVDESAEEQRRMTTLDEYRRRLAEP
jgi:P27 family predicted phage terminase small subunit